MSVSTLENYGNCLKVNFSDGSSVLAYPSGNELWYPASNSEGLISLETLGNQIKCLFTGGGTAIAYPSGNMLWYVGASSGGGGWEWPLNTSLWTISSPFGPRTVPTPGFHNGIDITGSGVSNTPVWAIADGLVTFNGFNSSAGNYVQLDHADNTRSLYMHFPDLVGVPALGTSVSKGDVIGRVGATGDATGPHLHFETHDPLSTPVDPILYMRARGHEFGEVQLS